MLRVLYSYIVEQKPMEILNYSLKHGYADLANKAAPITVSAPSALTLAAQILAFPGALVAWVCAFKRQFVGYSADDVTTDQILCTMG